jgi:hypothetical protein
MARATAGRKCWARQPDLECGRGAEIACAPDPNLSLAATLLAGGLSATLLDWATGVPIVDRGALVEDCALMCVAAGEAAVMRARSRQDAR